LFAIQSDIAQKVAQHLHAKLSASEKAAVEERPTQDLVAYDFYVRAVSMIYNAQVSLGPAAETPSDASKTLSEAVELLNKAVARDSNFFLAYCQLALAQQSLPNNAQVYELAGSMDCRQRRWADATNNLERACEIDPLNFPYLINLASTYLWLHDYDQHARIMDRIVALHPELRPGRI